MSPLSFPEVLDYWDAKSGITSSSERVSSWSPLKGSDALSQGTGANQPILLPYSGVNYLWLPGVAGNYVSVPSSAALQVTTGLDIDAYVALNTPTSGTTKHLGGKWLGTGSQYSYVFQVQATTGKLILSRANTGAVGDIQSAVSSVAPSWVAYSGLYVRVTELAGVVTFYTSTDGSNWTQLGTTQAVNNNTIFAGTAPLWLGVNQDLTSQLIDGGKLYRFRIYNGLRQSGGTLAFDANFAAVAEGATSFTESSSNGATVTINSTGAKPAQIVGSQQMLFDASAFSLSSAINLSATSKLALVVVMRTATRGTVQQIAEYTSDTTGASGFSMPIINGTRKISPANGKFGGILNQADSTATFTDNVYFVAASTYDRTLGTAQQTFPQINLSTGSTQIASSDSNGAYANDTLYFGARAGSSLFLGGQVKAIALMNTAPSQARFNQIIRAMAAQYGVSV